MKLLSLFVVLVSTACTLGEISNGDGADSFNEFEDVTGVSLFDQATFDGNGRTCLTCHSAQTGTLSIPQVRALLRNDPDNPLFLHDGLDDGVSGTTRIADHATIRVGLALPAGVTIASDPSASSVIVHRGIPSTRNSPALDPVIMWDGREPSLESQARSAILGHAQATREPTSEELALIVAFETTDPRSFSSQALMDFAAGGAEPQLPEGITLAQQRGRSFFIPGGLCAACHSGPMLNATPSGQRFRDVMVSSFNRIDNPVSTFVFPDGLSVDSPDPGRALITGNSAHIDQFKIPTLWGISTTAPYFHDNSALTLADVVSHYSEFFVARGQRALSSQEQADIAAYLQLL